MTERSSITKAAILYNPGAGNLAARRVVEWAAEALRADGLEVLLRPSRGPGQIGPLAAELAAAGVQALFAAGGDGTAGAAAEALAGSETVLGLLPIGTANLWAHELGLGGRLDSPGAVRAALRAQLDGQVRPVDLGAGHGRKFLLWAGVGLDAHIISRIEPRPEIGKRLGQLYYWATALWSGIDFRGGPMTVRTEQGEMSGVFGLAIAANIQRYAGTDSILDPDSRVDDGLLEVWTMEGESYRDSLSHLVRFKQGRHHDHPAIRRLRGREVTMEFGRPMPLQFDGELVDTLSAVRLNVLPGALRVLAPRRAGLAIFTERPL